ncbi:MAG: FAD synthetase family protein [Chloroflexi bacterium]|nr:FAD synthetase family protein [Chloroflexota bacterium]MBV9132933.1 FAD synthetase family protein [Chloroflexota bacterium]
MTPPAIVTIGNFDGVHLGHHKLIDQVVSRARALGLGSFAITFDPHPEQVLVPERKLTYLSTAEERKEILEQSGIDSVWICPFTRDLARLEPEEFMRLVTERQPIAELWVGADFALGRGRKGTIAVLAELGAASGWGLHMVAPLVLEGQVVSSTAIRTLLAAGAIRGAADLLGRVYSVPGEVRGDYLLVDPLRAVPRASVAYEAQVHQDGAVHETVVSVEQDPPRVALDHELPHRHGPARVYFVRRAD